ncbi:MAG: hypothetical protein U0892_15305 [Pirellulales bacterium]
MPSSGSIDDVLEYHRHLRLLAEAGVPVELSDSRSDHPLSRQLEQIESELGLRIGRAETLEDILSRSGALPDRYRRGLALWLACDGSPAALQAVAEHADAMKGVRQSLISSLLHPMIVMILGLFVFSVLLFHTAPRITQQYQMIGATPDWITLFLNAAAATFAYWLPVVALLVAWGCYRWHKHVTTSEPKLLPGYKEFVRHAGSAELADCLANLELTTLDRTAKQQLAGLRSQSKRNAGSRSNDDPITDAPGSELQPIKPSASSGTISERPASPLLRWADACSDDPAQRSQLFLFTSNFYRSRAARRADMWRSWAPAVIGGLLGGTVVLAYALSLFIPMVSLLRAIVVP